MSLNYIGISHFPVLHRQFFSPKSTISIESPQPSNEDLTQDNKDVVIERLNDLVIRLLRDSSVEDGTISAIHNGIDRIELLLKNRSRKSHRKTRSLGSEIGFPITEDNLMSPFSSARSARMRIPESSTGPTPHQSERHEASMSTERAAEIAKAAEDLASRLTATLAELQIRREESDHIHDMLVTRVETAAERILVLEYRVKEMEEDFDANQSELKFLRIQLQAIEAEFSQYTAQDVDPDLSQSILNWRIDWEDIDRRSKARRRKYHETDSSQSRMEDVLGD